MFVKNLVGLNGTNARYAGIAVGAVAHQCLLEHQTVGSWLRYANRSSHLVWVQDLAGNGQHVLVDADDHRVGQFSRTGEYAHDVVGFKTFVLNEIKVFLEALVGTTQCLWFLPV